MPRLRGYGAVIGGLVVLSAGLRFWAASGVPTPWIAPDEMLYALLGRSLWQHGSLDVLGAPTPFYSLVYPALAGLPLSVGSVHAGYTALKGLQAVVMSIAAVPVYLWGRSLVRREWAAAAAVLTLAIPGLAYSGMVMTEVLFYPLVVVCAWTAARALDRPTPVRLTVLVVACTIAALTRLQALVLVPAVLTAVCVDALIARDARRTFRFWPLAVPAVGVGLWLVVRGSAGLGGYAAAAGGSYGAGSAAKFVLYHAADLLLVCGVVPACAVVLMLSRAVRAGEKAATARAYLAVVSSFAAWFVVEVGVFASEHAGRIEERDLIGLAPLLFLGLALWLDRGAPRSYVASAVVAFAAAALVLALPFSRFVTEAAIPDSFTFAAVWRLVSDHGAIDPTYLVGLPAVGLAAWFVLAPRRWLPATVAVLVMAFGAASIAASLEVNDAASARRERLLGSEPRWVDAAAGGQTAIVFAGGGYWNTVWANLFWNRKLDRVYDTPGAHVPGPMPQRALAIGGDGLLGTTRDYAVMPQALTPDGQRLETALLPGSDQGSLILWKLARPHRLLLQTAGFQPNGDIYDRGVIRAYACTSGSFSVTLLGKVDVSVDVLLDGTRVRRVRLGPDESANVVVSVPAHAGFCQLDLVPSDVVGVTQATYLR